MTRLENYKIGVVDSGVGGLTVMKSLLEAFPDNHYFYFGDSGHAPYGGRPVPEMKALGHRMVDFLAQFHLDALVLACNTMSSWMPYEFRDRHHIPVIGTIEAGAREALKAYRESDHPWTLDHETPDIGIIGTINTVESGSFQKALFERDRKLHVLGLPCPSIVPVIEEGSFNHDLYRAAVEKDLTPWQGTVPPIVILGCTHFPIARREIQIFVGENIRLIDPAKGMVDDLANFLSAVSPKEPKESVPFYTFYTSGEKRIMEDMVDSLLGDLLTGRKYEVLREPLE